MRAADAVLLNAPLGWRLRGWLFCVVVKLLLRCIVISLHRYLITSWFALFNLVNVVNTVTLS